MALVLLLLPASARAAAASPEEAHLAALLVLLLLSGLLGLTAYALVRTRRRARAATDRARAESELRFRELAELLPEIVFETDLAGNVTFTNRRGYERTGYSEGELKQGFQALRLLDPADHERARENIARALAGKKREGEEYTAVSRDGARFPVLVFSSPILRDGRPVGLCGLIIDLTQMKELEVRRISERKLATVSVIAGGIAHDFNNILHGISGRIEHFQNRGNLDAGDRAALDAMGRACDRATGLVRRLLAFADKGPGAPVPYDVNREIREFCALSRHVLSPRTQLELTLDPALRRAWAEPVKIEQVLFNLFVGAEEALKGDGTVRIETGNHDEGGARLVRITVRGERTGGEAGQTGERTALFNGDALSAGLSLAIVKNLVEDSGGRVSYRSGTDDHRAALHVDLPAAPEGD